MEITEERGYKKGLQRNVNHFFAIPYSIYIYKVNHQPLSTSMISARVRQKWMEARSSFSMKPRVSQF